jgi:hypothetical protein
MVNIGPQYGIGRWDFEIADHIKVPGFLQHNEDAGK